jgi:hypothetical protein
MSIPIEMIDPTTNEAAERLHELDWYLRGALIGYPSGAAERVRAGALDEVRKALAAERRATVERIRPRVLQLCDSPGIRAAFDEEAAR